jgi:hypothetical protein
MSLRIDVPNTATNRLAHDQANAFLAHRSASDKKHETIKYGRMAGKRGQDIANKGKEENVIEKIETENKMKN